MLALLLVVTAWVPPLAAFAFAPDSAPRHLLAYSVFYWTLPVLALAVAAGTAYAISTTVVEDELRVLTVRGRGSFPLPRLSRMTSFSLWGYGSTHAMRLYGNDGARVMVVLNGPFTSFNRTNASRSRDLRAALQPYADRADERARWWLGAGARPARAGAAAHVARMMAVYAVGVVVALVVLVAYLSAALPTLH